MDNIIGINNIRKPSVNQGFFSNELETQEKKPITTFSKKTNKMMIQKKKIKSNYKTLKKKYTQRQIANKLNEIRLQEKIVS